MAFLADPRRIRNEHIIRGFGYGVVTVADLAFGIIIFLVGGFVRRGDKEFAIIVVALGASIGDAAGVRATRFVTPVTSGTSRSGPVSSG